jgi:hypothetical protein
VRDHQGQDVACLLFGPAAWKVAARDEFIKLLLKQKQQGKTLLFTSHRLEEVEIFTILTDNLDREASAQCAADFAAVTERFRDDLAALPHPLDHFRVVEVADRAEATHVLAQAAPLPVAVVCDDDAVAVWATCGHAFASLVT